MLEQIKRFGNIKAADFQREVEPVKPYPRINPQQQQHEDYPQQEVQQRPNNKGTRRRFTAMRELIEELKNQAKISRVDFNTANQELIDTGLSIAEEELINQLLSLKISLAGIDGLIKQMRHRSTNPTLVSGRNISASSNPFPVLVDELAEYVMRFDELPVVMGSQHNNIIDEINNNGRFVVENNRIRLNFTRVAAPPTLPDDPLTLTISIQLGAIEIDDNGRRAIFYQRPDQSYGLYSDKSISLSI